MCLEWPLPVTGELHRQRLRLALFSDHHLVQEPAAAPASAVMPDPHPVHMAQRHGLDQELIRLGTTPTEDTPLSVTANHNVLGFHM